MEKVITKENKYLRLEELVEGMTGEKEAYLIKIKRGIDINGNPYLTFYLKTADKAVLIGRKFRVFETDYIGAEMLSMSKSVVCVSFIVQIYNGSYTLIIKDIVLCPQQDPSPFFDSYLKSNETYDKLNKIASLIGAKQLDFAFKTAGLLTIQYGKSGAYLELLDMVYNIISARKSKYLNELLICFFGLVNPYFLYLTYLEKLEFIPKKSILDLLDTIVFDDERLTSIVADALSALMGQGLPEHLYSYIICNAFKTAMEQMELEELVKSSPKDLVISFKGKTLIYY